jgi:uncharacterized repeat protein (TIGR04138 family)
MADNDLQVKTQGILERDERYPIEAYEFVNAAVLHAVRKFNKDVDAGIKHVNAEELLRGLCAYATEQFGPLAWDVLYSWNLRSAQDVGQVVFNMIQEKLLAQGENDSIEDFNIDFKLRDALCPTFYDNTKVSEIKVPVII